MFIASILAAIGVSAATPLFLTLDQPSLNKYLLGNGESSEVWGHYLPYDSYVDGSGTVIPNTVEYYISCSTHEIRTTAPATGTINPPTGRPDLTGVSVFTDDRFGEIMATPEFVARTGGSIRSNATSTSDDDVIIPAAYGSQEITNLADNAFNSKTLKSVYIPATIGSFGVSTFVDCSTMIRAEIYAHCAIPSDAFLGCSALATVHIGSGVTSIASGAFSETIVSNVYYHGTLEQWAALPKSGSGLEGATVHYV